MCVSHHKTVGTLNRRIIFRQTANVRKIKVHRIQPKGKENLGHLSLIRRTILKCILKIISICEKIRTG
jgi:hypothetical protein